MMGAVMWMQPRSGPRNQHVMTFGRMKTCRTEMIVTITQLVKISAKITVLV